MEVPFSTLAAGYIGFLIAFLANVFLIVLILTQTKHSFGSYKYLMLWFAVWSLWYSFIDFMAQPSMHTYKNAFIVICASWFKYNNSLAPVLIAIYSTSFGCTVVLLAIHFIYRYIAISRPGDIRYFQWPIFWIWPALFLGVLVFWWWDVYFLLYSNEEVMNTYMRESVYSAYQDDIEKLSYIGPIYYTYDHSGNITINWPSCIAILNIYVIAIATLVTILTFGFRIHRKMKSVRDMLSSKTRELQRQLFYALMVQTIVPIIFMYTPATVLFLSPLFGIELGNKVHMTSIFLALYPALDPIVVMVFITDYRRFILRKIFGHDATSSTPTKVSTTTKNNSVLF